MALTLAATGLLAPLPASAAAQTTDGPCAAGAGVTVVVDFSDVGGSIATGCAAGDPETGRDALASAGFASADSIPGMICTIEATPDPCPETFDGSYWSYWHALPGEAWTSYLIGADTSAPVNGEVEGWRYNDGSAGPGEGTATLLSGAPDASTTDSPDPDADASASADSSTAGGVMLAAVAGGLLVLLVIAAIVLALKRRKGRVRP